MSKRKRFVITSLVLSSGFVAIQLFESIPRFYGIFGLSVLTLILFCWSLWEGLGLNATLLSLVLPVMYTLGVGVFWFLLPASIFARIPIVILYGAGIYALCSTENIFTVSAIRTIALIRAAHGVGFILTLVTSFFLFNAIVSMRQGPMAIFPLVFITSVALYIQGLWSILLTKEFSFNIASTSIIFGLVTGEVSVLLFFWPVTLVVGSLILTATLYILLGLGQADFEERLFAQTVREYAIVAAFVLAGMYFATRWG